MRTIGITGGIGSGKTTAARIFQSLGIPVYYADEAAKKLMQDDDALRQLLIAEFGTQVFDGNQLNRAYLSALVFDNPDKLKKLNAIVHPAVAADREAWIKQQTTPYVLIEAALLVENGFHKHCHHLICVYAPAEVRIARVMERDRLSREQVLARMQNQSSDETKIGHSRFVIHNFGNYSIIEQVHFIHQKLSVA